MKAPSEKHLEDWIVANPDWFGPRWYAEEYYNPAVDIRTEYRWPDDENLIVPSFERIVARQPRMPIGRPDLIVTNNYQITAIELKAGKVDTRTIAQCLRYMACLQEILAWTFTDRSAEFGGFPRQYYEWELSGFTDRSEIAGIVVGHSVENEHLYWVAAQTNIEIFTYDYEPDRNLYVFDCLHLEELETKSSSHMYREWAQGAVGDTIVDVFNYKAERQRRLDEQSQTGGVT